MLTNTELYKIAKSHLGEGGSKARKYCGMSSGPWCQAYACYIFNEGGMKDMYYGGSKVTYCPTGIKWCQKNWPQIPLYLALPMDLIYFDWEPNGDPNHVGFVKERESTSKIYTHEGNTSGGIVDEKFRPAGYIQGIFRPPFKPKSLPTTYVLKVDDNFDYATIYSLQHVLKRPETGVLTRGDVKALQTKVGTNADGAWGRATSKKVQKLVGTKDDGEFGPNSVKALKRWINKQVSPQNPDPEPEKPVEPPKPETYSGTFPELIPATARKAVELAYAYKTSLSVCGYKEGKPKTAFKTALEKAYPNRSTWGAKSRAGASCDVFAGVVMRASGTDSKFPRGLSEQKPHLKAYYKTRSSKKNGDILFTDTHIGIAVSIKGKMYNAQAHHDYNGGSYGRIEDVYSGYTAIYASNAKLTPIIFGDKFSDVKKLQNFLNWYGNYGLDPDYIFGQKTEDAVKDFQKNEGLEVDGEFGPKSLAKAKTVGKKSKKVFKGADISYIQRTVGVSNFKESGLDFIILRMGIRMKPDFKCTLDDVFEQNYKNANAAGLPIGGYFYSRAINKAEAYEEADFMAKYAYGREWKLPLYLDVEDTIRQSKLSKSELTTVINHWCTRMKDHGLKYGLYASMSWLENKIDVSKLDKNCSIWVAQYWNDKNKTPSAYKGMHDIWQYRSDGKVNGIAGSVDMNYLYNDKFMT